MKPPNLLAAAVIGGSVILAAAVFAMVGELLRGAGEAGTEETVARLEAEVAGQERTLQLLQGEVEALKAEVAALRAGGASREVVPAVPVPAPLPLPPTQGGAVDQFGGTAPPPETEGLVDPMELATARFNQGVERPRPSVLRELLGEPRDSYNQDCQPVTNPRLVRALETREIASFRLTMLRPALDSLGAIMERLRQEEPEIYAALGTAGALCARYVRGSGSSVSSHAWGAAVDLTLRGDLDRFGDASTQFGLVVLAEYFNAAGWYWGAGYSREDSMHFEVGEGLLRSWIAQGML